MFKYIATAMLTLVLGVSAFAAPAEPQVKAPVKKAAAAVKAECKKAAKECPKAAAAKAECKKACPQAAAKAVLPQCAKVVKADTNDMVTWYQDSTGKRYLVYDWAKPAVVFSRSFTEGAKVLPGSELMTVAPEGRSKGKIKNYAALRTL